MVRGNTDLDILYREEDGVEGTVTVRRDQQPTPRRDTIPVVRHGSVVVVNPDDPTLLRPAPHAAAEFLDDLPTAGDPEDDSDLVEPPDPQRTHDDGTHPTLSLTIPSVGTREIYRLFLANEFGPALALVDDLIAGGEDDPVFLSIARECRAALETERSGGPDPRTSKPRLRIFSGVHGKMTLEQLAATTGMSLDQILTLLERFVMMGVLTLRPPRG